MSLGFGYSEREKIMYLKNRLCVLLALVSAFLVSPIIAQAQPPVQQAAVPDSAPASILPAAPGLALAQVQQQCLAFFGKKVTYTGRTPEDGKDYTLVLSSEGEMLVRYDRPVCKVAYEWRNARQEGRNVTVVFDGRAILDVWPKEPALGMTMVMSNDGSSLVFLRRFADYYGNKKIGTQSGTFLRK
ncbi:MAG: hypothetical protein NT019_01580 [Candidatus Adlerbacteria bacterium]|nr:hypothetical protein [Candidatus Adlerbacteria bacterium]